MIDVGRIKDSIEKAIVACVVHAIAINWKRKDVIVDILLLLLLLLVENLCKSWKRTIHVDGVEVDGRLYGLIGGCIDGETFFLFDSSGLLTLLNIDIVCYSR